MLSQRRARELAHTERLRAWIEQESSVRTELTRAQTPQLNHLLCSWFTHITIRVEPRTVVIAATRRHRGAPAEPVSVSIDRADWTRSAPPGHRKLASGAAWVPAETIGALRAWADEHGRSPRRVEWKLAGPAHPCSLTVCRQFGEWSRALARAKLAPVAREARHPWSDEEIIAALQSWARARGRAPAHIEWKLGTPERPCAQTVWIRFGGWATALRAAGLDPPPRPPYEGKRWSRAETLAAINDWSERHGRPPTTFDWASAAGAEHPSVKTVYKHFGSWAAGLEAASNHGEPEGSP